MSSAVQFTQFRGAAERFNRFAQNLDTSIVIPTVPSAQFLKRGEEFLEVLGASVLTMEKAFDVAGDQLPLRRAALLVSGFVGSGNTIAAGMFGDVHSRVGDTNNFFRGEPMHGETGDTKAAGDEMFLQHGIGRKPEAQTFGKDLGLLDSGFGHENDELVAAVAGDHVGLPAFLLEQSPHAGKHEVSLEMPQRVVDFLEFVEVNE